MRVLSFPNFSKNRTPVKGKDWSQQEIADFYRAHRLLVENGAGIGIDRGVTDIEEPWIVFYDLATQDVFMHVARIDGKCILLCEALGIRLSAATIADLILNFEAAVRDHLAVRTERHSNVVLHPAARIIISISAIFLLSKLDNSGVAYAKGFAAEQGNAAEATKKSDVTVLARAQTALGRLFETVDSPRAVASLAGVIITGELLVNMQMTPRDAEGVHRSHAEDFVAVAKVDGNAGASETEKPLVLETVHHVQPVMQETELHRAMVPVVVAAKAEEIPHKQIFEDSFAGQVLATANAPVVPATIEPQVAALSGVGTAVINQRPTEAESDATNTVTPEAFKALETLLGLDLDAQKAGLVSIVVSPISAGGLPAGAGESEPDSQPELSAIDISLASLDQLNSVVGFYMQTALSDQQFRDVVMHFMDNIGSYELEYQGRQVFIEQNQVADLANTDIGLWTNVMSDGSTVSFVGQASLIDDVVMLVA